ncbi:MAG TPA: PqiC family protein [Marinagarivorans sp.]
MITLSGCAFSPKTHFYTLTGIGHQRVAGAEPSAQLPDGNDSFSQVTLAGEHSYGIGPLFLPEALMQPGVVTHRQGQSVNLSLYNIWAGNLREAVTRVVASNISELTDIDAVWPFPWDNRNRPTRQIRIVFEQFAGELGGELILKAKWALTEQNGEKVLLQERVVLTDEAKGSGYGPYVDSLNNLVNRLSENMVLAIAELDKTSEASGKP